MAFVMCSKSNPVDSQGHPISLSHYKGKWVLVNYWAKWCEPCLKELPELDAFYQAHQNNVMVLGVSFDNLSNIEINDFSKQLGIHFPMLRKLPLMQFNVAKLDTLPTTIVISPQGKLTKVLYGPQDQTHLLQITGIMP
jgi:thiol-disulfide isomerase/thioredoxin